MSIPIPTELIGANEEAFEKFAARIMRRKRQGGAPVDGAAVLKKWEKNARPYMLKIACPSIEHDEIRAAEELGETLRGHLDELESDEHLGGVSYFFARHRPALFAPSVVNPREMGDDALTTTKRRRRNYVPNQRGTNRGDRPSADELDNLRFPDDEERLISMIEHGDFSTLAMRRIRDVANERLEVKVKRELFGSKKPSAAGLETYLSRLHAASDAPPYDEKRVICTNVNSWKDRLNLEFVFESPLEGGDIETEGENQASKPIICTLSFKPDGSQGAFRLREIGAAQTEIYSRTRFPRLTVRRANTLSSAQNSASSP